MQYERTVRKYVSNLRCPQYETLFLIQDKSYPKSNISSQTLLRETRAKIPNKGTGKLQKNVGIGELQSRDTTTSSVL